MEKMEGPGGGDAQGVTDTKKRIVLNAEGLYFFINWLVSHVSKCRTQLFLAVLIHLHE
jgi:hypothetical protein